MKGEESVKRGKREGKEREETSRRTDNKKRAKEEGTKPRERWEELIPE